MLFRSAALQSLGERESGTGRLEAAVRAYQAALQERTRERVPLDWAATQFNLALAELALAQHEATTDPGPHLHRALAHVTAALEVYDPAQSPYNYDNAVRLRDQIAAALAVL